MYLLEGGAKVRGTVGVESKITVCIVLLTERYLTCSKMHKPMHTRMLHSGVPPVVVISYPLHTITYYTTLS